MHTEEEAPRQRLTANGAGARPELIARGSAPRAALALAQSQLSYE